MRYYPHRESITKHPLPEWYDEAKFGIMIHWSLYSVPAFALPTAQFGEIPIDEYWYSFISYAEWYQNSIRIGARPFREYHEKTFGKDFRYEQFADLFKAEYFDAAQWSKLFKKVGAKYVVLATKHHDGFCLWNSKYTEFNSYNLGPKRDIVEELANAVRAEGIRFGTYYSGLLDWRFSPYPILTTQEKKNPPNCTKEYADYAYMQCMELIDKYKPSLLWGDIGWPRAGFDYLNVLWAHFYNTVPDGVINDRWSDGVPGHEIWCDFTTLEYKAYEPSKEKKWEMIRGLGLSFGYNQFDKYIDKNELITLLIDCVSKGGNLLLNIGPKADGTIPKEQVELLNYLADWMEINSESIYGTKPFIQHESKWDQTKIYFTQKESDLYVFLCNMRNQKLYLPKLHNCAEKAHVLGNYKLDIQNEDGWVSVAASNLPDDVPPIVIRFNGVCPQNF